MEENSPEIQKSRTYKRVFTTEDGGAILNDLMVFCNMIQPCYDPQNVNETIFNEGKRSVALFIMTQLNMNEAQFKQRIKEMNDDGFTRDW